MKAPKHCEECKLAGSSSKDHTVNGDTVIDTWLNGYCELERWEAPREIENCLFMQDYTKLFVPEECSGCEEIVIRGLEWLECYESQCVNYEKFHDMQSKTEKQDDCGHERRHGFITIENRNYYVCLDCNFIKFNKFTEE
jgi:hypothetical protein